jgi:flagellar biosynthetic protein FliO
VTTVVSGLAIVLGLFFAFVWLARKGAPSAAAALPSEVVQVLGRASLAPRQQMQLVRIGDKLLLVAVTATGAQTLTEITDRAEVERLAAACEAARGSSATASFRQVLSQLETEPAAGGFFGRAEQPAAANTRMGGRRPRTAEQSHA